MWYCGVEHQKEDRKRHKVECFPAGATCTRCLEVIPSPPGMCRVPHPNHLRQDQGSMFGGGAAKYNFSCGACSGFYTLKGKPNVNLKDLPIVAGPKYCFEGSHTVKSLNESDQRRVFDDVVVISGDLDTMQEKIDALDGNEKVKVLKLTRGGAYYDSEKSIKLAVSLLSLEEVILEDVNMTKIVLNNELTPNVKKLWMQNPSESEDPDFHIVCPLLEEISIYYWGPGHYKWLADMLGAAKSLKRFDSYKLRVSHLGFASNHLKSIRLHRAELLERIDLWAPRLVDLNVQAAYDLNEIHFLKKHDLMKELPANFAFGDELCVNATNANLGAHAIESIVAHPRFRGDSSSLETDYDF